MDKGKQKMTAQEYEQDRRSKKMARNPPSQERLHLQPAAPLPSAMGKGKRKMTIDEYEEGCLSKNAKKPPPAPLAGSLIATNGTQPSYNYVSFLPLHNTLPSHDGEFLELAAERRSSMALNTRPDEGVVVYNRQRVLAVPQNDNVIVRPRVPAYRYMFNYMFRRGL